MSIFYGAKETSMANDVARKLRKAMTRQEVKLWVRLRELRTLGFHFRRQAPLEGYVVDFECRRRRLIVEVDGTQHGFDDHRRKDSARDRKLAERGYRVLRFGNPDVDGNMEGVLELIRLALLAPMDEPVTWNHDEAHATSPEPATLSTNAGE
jgi:very-short-patch-repair endonuclease